MLMRLLRRFMPSYKTWVAAIVVLQFMATAATLYLPTLNARIIDNGVAKGDTDYIWRVGGLMLAVAGLQVVAQVLAARCGATLAQGVGRDVRATVFDHTLSFSTEEVSRFGAPSLITRTTNDVQQIQMLLLMGSFLMVSAPLTAIGGVILALRENAGLSWLILVAVLALAIVMGLLMARMGPLFASMQVRIDSLNRVLREQITGIRVIRAFAREEHEAARFDRANVDLTDVTLRVGRLMVTMFPAVMLITNVTSVAVVWFGGHRIADGDLQIGQLTAFLQYVMQILMGVMMATMVMMMAPRAAACAERIMEVLDTPSSVPPPQDPITAVPDSTVVEFDHVDFAYPGAEEPVLSELTFTAAPGQTTAIVGATGSGKSTLLNLIPRLYDVTSGAVRIGGVAVDRLHPETLWRQLAIVPQKSYLFSGTIATNLRYGRPDASEEELWEALRVAQAADFVSALPDGLEAHVAQGGTNYSGGQQQRLAIARALVARPGIYLFDDSFSALDVATDARLRAALRPRTAGATVIVVAQRVSSIMDADQILVLEAGRIIGRGRHRELLETCPTYQEIVASQLGEEEAA